MKKLTMLAGASLLVIAGSVFAAEPLNDAQMDGVSAGAVVATGLGNAYGIFQGDNLSVTTSVTAAIARPTLGFGFAYGGGTNTTIATSLLGFAGAQSASSAAASLQ